MRSLLLLAALLAPAVAQVPPALLDDGKPWPEDPEAAQEK